MTIAIVAMVGVLLSAFAVSWFWWRQSHPSIAVPEYALIGPIVTSTNAYSVSAKIALQTGSADAEWAKKNNAALRSVLESALLSLEPQQVHAPGGLLTVQTHLLGAIQQQLKTNKIEQLLLTDFILQSDV